MKVNIPSNCVRCSEMHGSLEFKQFHHPVMVGNGSYYSYWATCPVNGDPILLRVIEDFR